MVSTAFFKGIIILTRQINFYRNRIFLLTAQNPDFFERIFAFRRILPLFFVQYSCVLRVFHRGISLFSAELPLY